MKESLLLGIGIFAVVFVAIVNPFSRNLTTEDYEDMVAQSDDADFYQGAFAYAAYKLVEAGMCDENDFRELGGWVKSQTQKRKPVYFIYCGGSKLTDKIYVNAETYEFSGAAEGDADGVEWSKSRYLCTTKDTGMAFVMLQDTVRAHLRSPSTAEFPWSATQAVYVGDCVYEVVSHVDAQNGFGATIREPWYGRIRKLSKRRWQPIEVKVGS